MWGANTFPMRNRLPYPFLLVAMTMLFLPSGLCGVSFPSLGINTHCWRLFCFVSAPPSRLYCGFHFRMKIPGATAGDSTGDCDRPIAGPLPLRVNPSACLFIFGCLFTTLHTYLFCIASYLCLYFPASGYWLDCSGFSLVGGMLL